MADLGRRYRISSQVLAKELGDDLVLLDPQSGRYFTLNRSGRAIWKWLDGTLPARDLVDRMASDLDAPAAQAAADLAELLDELLAEDLVQVLD